MGDQIDSVATPSCAVVMIGGEDALGFVTIQRQILWLTDAQALRQRWWSDLM